MDADVVAGRVADAQHGLITREQASEAGVTAGQIQRRVRSGRWSKLHTGVFALAGAPRTWEQRVVAAILAAGPGAIASHLCAAVIQGFPDAVPGVPEITVPPGRHPRLRGARVHRPAFLPEYDQRVVRGIPVTSYARTLVDCSGRMSLGQLARALDHGIVQHEVTVWSVERTLGGLKQAPGRHPSKLWTLLAERGAETVLAESRPEARIARVLSDAGLAAVQQHWVRVGDDNFRLDLAYPQVRVAIEYDGWDPHRSRRAFDRDRRRDRMLQSAGWTVLRVTSQTTDADLIASVRLCTSRSQ
jgi:very-short-patch-repair endonuclease